MTSSHIAPESTCIPTPSRRSWRIGVLATVMAVLLSNRVGAWTTDGVEVLTSVASGRTVTDIQTLPDGSGGCWIAWADNRSGSFDIYLQGVNSEGVPQFTADGVVVCNASGDQTQPRLAADIGGNVLLCWEDRRYASTLGVDVFLQRVTGTGQVATGWPTNGLAATARSADQVK